ncbi:enoyl-CoA hydratase/isomerase family protein [Microbacterium mangrovi]|uniref:enoyl-CoA hydratase/isomerase family protein n=1 Tax=Microbacterium mangrovi TaxID=1348253 RepID=UPI00068D0488|nr:enoyl-CoA hydratase/isomerase family protein [Microbacterium mangrovi]
MTDGTPEASISWRVDSGVATIELRNLAQRNALTPSMCRELIAAFAELDAREDVLLIFLRGAGGTFCSGVAVAHLREVLLEHAEAGDAGDLLSLVDAAIGGCQTFVIALVEGFCFGGGWQLASACDAIVADEHAQFAITPAKLGVIYPRVGLERLARLAGPSVAKLLLATGMRFDATQALGYGLVADVVAENGLDERAAELSRAFLSNSQFTIWATKRLIDAETTAAPELDDLWRRLRREMATGPDADLGIRAFTAHHRPVFPWRRTTATAPLSEGDPHA